MIDVLKSSNIIKKTKTIVRTDQKLNHAKEMYTQTLMTRADEILTSRANLKREKDIKNFKTILDPSRPYEERMQIVERQVTTSIEYFKRGESHEVSLKKMVKQCLRNGKDI